MLPMELAALQILFPGLSQRTLLLIYAPVEYNDFKSINLYSLAINGPFWYFSSIYDTNDPNEMVYHLNQILKIKFEDVAPTAQANISR